MLTIQLYRPNQSYRIVDSGPINLLLRVLLLLELEDVLVKIELQVLVRVVDAQLLETVLRESFEAEDVEDRNGSRLLCALVDDMVDACD